MKSFQLLMFLMITWCHASIASVDYQLPADLIHNIGPIRATYLVTDSLLGADETDLMSYCEQLASAKYNLVLVNIQARGFVLDRRGLKLKLADGQEILYPGHPHILVDNPIAVMRKHCEQQSSTVVVVPWIEYNAMADLKLDFYQSKNHELPLKGYNEQGELIELMGYDKNNSRSTIASAEAGSLTFFPYPWYVQNEDHSLINGSKWGHRWLDMKQVQVQDFMFAFAQAVTERYGLLQHWDRMRFAPGRSDVNYGPDNNQSQFIYRLSSELIKQNGRLWLSVVMPEEQGKYGQHWQTWQHHVQMLSPMFYLADVDQFKKSVQLMWEDNEAFKEVHGKDKYVMLPLIDRTGLMQNSRASVYEQQLKVVQSLGLGYVDWYFEVKPRDKSQQSSDKAK